MIIDKNLLDITSKKAKDCERLQMNYNFHDSFKSKAQIMLNAMEPGTIVPIGRHRKAAEIFVVLRGTIKVMFKNRIMEQVLDPKKGIYGVYIPKDQWYQVESLEYDTVIFEAR